MIRASSLFRTKLCPASAALESTVPEESSQWAEEGTLLHMFDADPSLSRDDITDDQRELLDENLAMRTRFTTEWKSKLGIEGIVPKTFIEREFAFCDEEGEPVLHDGQVVTGHPDRVEWYRPAKVVIVCDSKFGFKRVTHPEASLQMQAYSVMVSEDFGAECNTVVAVITQPRLRSTTHAVFSRVQLADAKREILDIIKLAQSPGAEFNPSEEACHFCRAKAFCKAALTMAAQVGDVDVGDLKIAELEEIGFKLQAAKDIIKAWEARIRFICQAKPGLLKKWGLSKAQELVEITDPRAAFQRLVDAGLLAPTEEGSRLFFNCCKASRYQLEKTLAKLTRRPLSQVKEEVETALEGVLVTKQKQPSIEAL